jgi:IclR family acetate operon transcriptional repressor
MLNTMVQSVARALGLLEALDAAGADGLALGELARAAGLKAPTVHSLLATLEARGYVRQDAGTRRYGLGDRARRLGGRQSLLTALAEAGGAVVAAVRAALGETALLAVDERSRRRTLVCAESGQDLRVAADVGEDERFYTTATGRVLLSLLPPDELAARVAALGLPGPAWPSADSAEALTACLAAVRAAGVARYESAATHVVAWAVPVPLNGPVRAALGLYLPAARASDARETELVSALRAAAAGLAARVERSP